MLGRDFADACTMSSLQDWERKMRERRRNTPFNTYLKEIVSWWPINLHRRDGVVSRYPRTERMPSVVTTEAFSDAVQARGELDYDFSSGFWDNYERLARGIPFPNVIHISSENCEFADIVGWSKNAYLSFIVMESQDVLYSYGVKDHSSDVVSSAVVKGSNNVYASSGVLSSSNIYYSRYIESSSDIWFCDNLVGCHECIFCSHLENASYRIGGEQLEREEYLRRKADLLSRKGEFDTWARRVDKHGRNT